MADKKKVTTPEVSPNQPLKAAREKAGVGVTEAAEALGLIPTNLSATEAGRRNPSVELVLNMCALYMISPNELLGWVDPVGAGQ